MSYSKLMRTHTTPTLTHRALEKRPASAREVWRTWVFAKWYASGTTYSLRGSGALSLSGIRKLECAKCPIREASVLQEMVVMSSYTVLLSIFRPILHWVNSVFD